MLSTSPSTCRGGPRVPPAAEQDPQPMAFSKPGQWGPPRSFSLPAGRSPQLRVPCGEQVSLPSPSSGWGAAAARRCHSPGMAAGHRPGRPGQCTSPRSFVGLLLHIPGHQYFNGLEVPFYRSFWVVFIFLLLGSIAVSIAFKDCRSKR